MHCMHCSIACTALTSWPHDFHDTAAWIFTDSVIRDTMARRSQRVFLAVARVCFWQQMPGHPWRLHQSSAAGWLGSQCSHIFLVTSLIKHSAQSLNQTSTACTALTSWPRDMSCYCSINFHRPVIRDTMARRSQRSIFTDSVIRDTMAGRSQRVFLGSQSVLLTTDARPPLALAPV